MLRECGRSRLRGPDTHSITTRHHGRWGGEAGCLLWGQSGGGCEEGVGGQGGSVEGGRPGIRGQRVGAGWEEVVGLLLLCGRLIHFMPIFTGEWNRNKLKHETEMT